ncbi:superoxide dismutase family protein [Pseudotabrizicola sp. 4114]|uniref:superoxide dismutase family protein n=1 Tax=Pseudotabrizicola sp. 4114 TaxID=2817731 RepID=UPI00285B1B4E|nr:Cu-Zn family superoxide dismutase [Pseudorhodobacter sp. 4114]
MTRSCIAAQFTPCLVAIGLAALPSFAIGQTAQTMQTAEATFVDGEGAETGKAHLTGTPSGVLIGVEVNGLPPARWVAFHVHETGSCDHTGQHESAGGHFNPSNVEHGFLSETGPHAGDMQNIWVDDAGTARAEVFNPFVLLAEGENSILGRALMIHAEPDDHKTQPSGAAGERLACAVIE